MKRNLLITGKNAAFWFSLYNSYIPSMLWLEVAIVMGWAGNSCHIGNSVLVAQFMKTETLVWKVGVPCG